jgi:CelD/BcsL family acetyltransferase involved in cellulose biosynthesis
MNVALRESPSDDTPRHRVTRDMEFNTARIDVYDELAAAKPIWQELIEGHAAATPYQRYEWVALWHEHVSRHQGMTPLIVVGRGGDGSPLFLWPFARRDAGSLVTASYFC